MESKVGMDMKRGREKEEEFNDEEEVEAWNGWMMVSLGMLLT